MTEFMTDAQLYEMPPSRMRELLAAEAASKVYREALAEAEAERDALKAQVCELLDLPVGQPISICPYCAEPMETTNGYAVGRHLAVRHADRFAALHPKEAPHG